MGNAHAHIHHHKAPLCSPLVEAMGQLGGFSYYLFHHIRSAILLRARFPGQGSSIQGPLSSANLLASDCVLKYELVVVPSKHVSEATHVSFHSL